MSEVDETTALAFLNMLFPKGSTQGKGFLNLWTRDGKRSHWYGVDELGRAAADLPSLNVTGCVWYQTGLIAADKGSSSRGGAGEVIGYPGLHADVDVYDPNAPAAHKSSGASDLPPDLNAASQLTASLNLKPTCVVVTGHGLQPHWLFDAPLALATDSARERIKRLQAGLQAILRQAAAEKGWKLDSTPDLVRLLRIPGTVNRKPGCAPVPVELIYCHGPRYSLAYLEQWVAKRLPAPAPVPVPVTTSTATPNMESQDTVRGDADVLAKANGAANGEKFRALWSGSVVGYKSPSEAMQALLCCLAFWTRDTRQLERLASQSKMVVGYDKWDRPDYRERSIRAALETVKPSNWTLGIAQDKGAEKQSQAATLLRLASPCDYWHDPERRAYATVPLSGGGRANYRVDSDDFRNWLSSAYYKSEGKSHSATALDEAVGALTARAVFDGPEQHTFIRIAELSGDVYVDLGCPKWRAVEITWQGWRVVDSPPVRFVRRRGMLPLADPVTGGDLADLRRLLNATDEGFVMMVAWLLGAFRGSGPYPILSVSGEQGSAKSTTCRLLRRLIDPHIADVAQPPKSDQDLMTAAANGWVYSIDNLSGLSGDTSDTLCRLATGAAWRSRQLYTDGDEHIMQVCRPVLLNGIGELSGRADLAERSLLVHLPAIPPSQRRTETDVMEEFGRLSPGLLGALLSAVAGALANGDSVTTMELPRMADFARWIVAAEPYLPWDKGGFLKVYRTNQDEGRAAALESNPVAGALAKFAADMGGEWTGQLADLLSILAGRVSPRMAGSQGWPQSPRALATALRRIAPSLRAVAGLEVALGRRTDGTTVTVHASVPVATGHESGGYDEPWS